MKNSIKVETALKFTKYSVFLLRCWPPKHNVSRAEKIIFDLSWWFMFFSSLGLLFPIMASVYVYRSNSEVMTKSICLSCAVSQCAVKTLFCKIRRLRLQWMLFNSHWKNVYTSSVHNKLLRKRNILEDMEDFVKNADDFQRRILDRYVSQCATVHLAIVIWVYFTSLSFIIGPFFIPQDFPTDAVYPFPVSNIYIRILIYSHQSLVGLQTSAAVLLDTLVAVLLWFVCARFQIMALTIPNSRNFHQLRSNIEKYQNLLRYTREVRNTINLFVFSTILTSVGGILFSAIQLLAEQSMAIKAQYAVVAVTASVGLFISSWAADTLLQVEYLVGLNVFHSNWASMENKSKTCIMHVISQSQSPITIQANRILPTLSLAFFSQFLMTSFKFCASLKVLIESD